MTAIMSKPIEYLSINEQVEIKNKLYVITDTSPMRDVLFYSHGDKFALGALLASSVVFWRCGFRGFNLSKYNRGRISTLAMSLACPFPAGLWHSMFVRETLHDFYRPENMLSYGVRSLIAHQFGLAITLVTGTGLTFLSAQKIGIIPVGDNLFNRDVRKVAYKQYLTRLRPYAKTMVTTFAASSALMFLVGLQEYKQSRALLAKLNRTTLSLKEE